MTCRSNSHQLRVAPRGPAYPTRPHLRYRPLGYPSSPIEKHWHFVLPPARYLCRQAMIQSLVQYTIAPSSLTHRAPLNAFSFYIEQAKLRGGKVLPIVFVFVFLAFPFLPRSTNHSLILPCVRPFRPCPIGLCCRIPRERQHSLHRARPLGRRRRPTLYLHLQSRLSLYPSDCHRQKWDPNHSSYSRQMTDPTALFPQRTHTTPGTPA